MTKERFYELCNEVMVPLNQRDELWQYTLACREAAKGDFSQEEMDEAIEKALRDTAAEMKGKMFKKVMNN